MVTSIVLVVTAFITPALAWDKEYEGFAHFHNWDGLVTDLQQQVKFHLRGHQNSQLRKRP